MESFFHVLIEQHGVAQWQSTKPSISFRMGCNLRPSFLSLLNGQERCDGEIKRRVSMSDLMRFLKILTFVIASSRCVHGHLKTGCKVKLLTASASGWTEPSYDGDTLFSISMTKKAQKAVVNQQLHAAMSQLNTGLLLLHRSCHVFYCCSFLYSFTGYDGLICIELRDFMCDRFSF